MPVETLDDIIEELADRLGIYGAHPDPDLNESDRASDCTDKKPCRMCFTESMRCRILWAIEVDKKLAAEAELQKLTAVGNLPIQEQNKAGTEIPANPGFKVPSLSNEQPSKPSSPPPPEPEPAVVFGCRCGKSVTVCATCKGYHVIKQDHLPCRGGCTATETCEPQPSASPAPEAPSPLYFSVTPNSVKFVPNGADANYVWYGGKYYTLNHPACVVAFVAAIERAREEESHQYEVLLGELCEFQGIPGEHQNFAYAVKKAKELAAHPSPPASPKPSEAGACWNCGKPAHKIQGAEQGWIHDDPNDFQHCKKNPDPGCKSPESPEELAKQQERVIKEMEEAILKGRVYFYAIENGELRAVAKVKTLQLAVLDHSAGRLLHARERDEALADLRASQEKIRELEREVKGFEQECGRLTEKCDGLEDKIHMLTDPGPDPREREEF